MVLICQLGTLNKLASAIAESAQNIGLFLLWRTQSREGCSVLLRRKKMSKDMIGSVVRAAVGVPQERLELLARIASDFAKDNPRGYDWHERYMQVREQGLPAPEFECNEHGHVLVSIVGIDLTGEQEIARSGDTYNLLRGSAKDIFMRKGIRSYDKNHRLEDGHEYHLALIPIKDIPTKDVGEGHAIHEVQKYTASFGYGKPLAGITMRLREIVSNEMMKKMGFEYIGIPHDPIKADGFDTNFYIDRNDGQCVDTDLGSYFWKLNKRGALAYLVSAS